MRNLYLLSAATALLVGCVGMGGGSSESYLTEIAPCTIECYITQWQGNKNKALVFTWDDNASGAKTVAEVFDKYGMKTTFFVNTAEYDNWKYRVRNPFMKGMFQRIVDDGHELGSHTRSHKVLTQATEEEIKMELFSSATEIHKLWGIIPSCMSHPNSKYNATIDTLVLLYYLDSRYSIAKDRDSTIRYMSMRTSYDFSYYKKQLDLYFASNANRYVFGGHQLTDYPGYEPMPEAVLDSLLNYVVNKYEEDCWVTTFENMTMYGLLRDNITINNLNGNISIDLGPMAALLEKYPHPSACITLCFQNENLDFASVGIQDYWFCNGNSYCTIDLRKSTNLQYGIIDKNIEP